MIFVLCCGLNKFKPDYQTYILKLLARHPLTCIKKCCKGLQGDWFEDQLDIVLAYFFVLSFDYFWRLCELGIGSVDYIKQVGNMTDRSPILLEAGYLTQPQSKHKFWETSMAGNQRSPKNMSYVTASDLTNQQEHQPNKEAILLVNSNHHEEDSEENSNSNTSEEVESAQNEITYQKRVGQLEAQTQKLRNQIQEGRTLNANILKELNKTTNQLRASERLNEQLNQQCDKLYTNVKLIYDKQSEVQNSKMALMIQISQLNQQKQLAINKSQIIQQEMHYLQNKIQILYEDISFEKSISADFKKQTIMLKEQLMKTVDVMNAYSQLQIQVKKQQSINEEIKFRFARLQDELKQTREKVLASEKSQQKYLEDQNRLFTRIQQLENQNGILDRRIMLAHGQIEYSGNEQKTIEEKQKDIEARYVQILQQYEKRHEDLVFQLLALNQRNHKLVDERDFFQRRFEVLSDGKNQRLPYEQFVSILRATEDQVKKQRQKYSLKQDQFNQLKTQYQLQVQSIRDRVDYLTKILQGKQRQFLNREQVMQTEVSFYKKQFDLMARRNEELKNNQIGLRAQISQKDRIIVNFVDRQKIQQQAKERAAQSGV